MVSNMDVPAESSSKLESLKSRVKELEAGDARPTLRHFSHPQHPLSLAFSKALCQACKLPPSSAWTYKCDVCDYVVHASCSQMPQLIHHPVDLQHPLYLLTAPAYASGGFICNACGDRGDGFCYHCSLCNVDLHLHCVSVPLSHVTSVHAHPLALVSATPSERRCDCDVCGHGVSSRYWRYHCNQCNFDAHLYCVRGKSLWGMNDQSSKQEASGGDGKKGRSNSIFKGFVRFAAMQVAEGIVQSILENMNA